MKVFRVMWSNTGTTQSTATSQLLCGALFYGMRSCEYSKVKGPRKTKILRIRDIEFRHNNKEIPKTKRNLKFLKFATTVTVNFMDQKVDRSDRVTMPGVHDINELSPATTWGAVVERVLSYPGTSLDSPVNLVRIGKHNVAITSEQTAIFLKATVTSIGKDELGFTEEDVGTHSIRSSLAMMLYLTKARTATIMEIGRWASDAFLLYIRKQVLEFSRGLTEQMIKNDFYTLPDIVKCQENDPRTRKSNSSTSLFQIGENKGQREIAKRPAFQIW